MANDNRAFGELLSKFYENGLLKEVYRTEKVVVCNAFNQFYVAFSLDLVDSYTQDFPGFSMNSSGLRYIVEDDNFVFRYFQNLSSKAQDDALFLLNEAQFAHFQAHQEEFRQRPVKVDLAFEQKVLEKARTLSTRHQKHRNGAFLNF